MSEPEKPLKNPELYDLLEACTNDELAPIVEALTKSGASTLRISRTFERHSPDHHQYTDQIGDEIYRLSLTALGRGDGERAAYETIVAGLCKKIGIAAMEEVDAAEANLLNLFSKRTLLSVPVQDQQLAVDDARTDASAAVGGFWTSDAWPPLASCILQIGYLRDKLIADGRITGRSLSELTIADRAAASEGENALVISTEDGSPVLTIGTLKASEGDNWRDVRNDRSSRDLLTPILKAVQPLLSAERLLSSGNYARITLPPGAELVFSDKLNSFIGVARRADNKFATVLLDPVNLASIATPAMLLTFATAMAEQKKLEEINRKLTEIKLAVEHVAMFQTDERRSVLTGSIRYFQQVAEAVLTGEYSDEVLHVIEQHEAALIKLQEHIAKDIGVQVEAIRALKGEAWFGSGKFVQTIQDHQKLLGALYRDVMLCIRARGCGWQLLHAYPGRERRKEARFNDINATLDRFAPIGDLTAEMDRLMRDKIQGISAATTKLSLLQSEQGFCKRLADEAWQIRSDLRDVERLTTTREQPISMDLRLENGEIVASRML